MGTLYGYDMWKGNEGEKGEGGNGNATGRRGSVFTSCCKMREG